MTAIRAGLLGLGLSCLSAAVSAQSPAPGGMPPPPGMTLAASTAMRFPQPVRAGTLIGRDVIRPVEAQDYVGSVRALVENASGQVLVVMKLGGFLGFGGRLVAVPLDAMVLLGQDMEVVALTPAQLRTLPAFSAKNLRPVDAARVLKVGLAKPSH